MITSVAGGALLNGDVVHGAQTRCWNEPGQNRVMGDVAGTRRKKGVPRNRLWRETPAIWKRRFSWTSMKS